MRGAGFQYNRACALIGFKQGITITEAEFFTI